MSEQNKESTQAENVETLGHGGSAAQEKPEGGSEGGSEGGGSEGGSESGPIESGR